MNTIGTCGMHCGACQEFGKKCPGCREVRGEVYWAKEADMPVCPLYECPVMTMEFADCGECPDLPCSLFYTLRDPSIPEEEHTKEIGKRVERLKNLSRR
jgi:hypothetical protein